jgi:hypothetical protein
VAAVADEDQESAAWSDLRERIGVYMETVFILSIARDKEIWQFIVGRAARRRVLWTAAGEPGSWEEFEDHLTLGNAVGRIEAQKLLDTTTIDNLRAADRLRNSVAHREAVSGVTVRGSSGRGVYKGRHVFADREGLTEFASDTDAAISAMYAWRQAHRQPKT